MKHTLTFLVFVIVVVGLLYSISGKKYPQIPPDSDHKAATEVAACLTCHGTASIRPRKPEHPPKDDCFQCHKRKRVKKTG